MKFLQDFKLIGKKQKQLTSECEALDDDFAWIQKPQKFPQAYRETLQEISRRREYALVFEKKWKGLQDMQDLEKKRRKRFLAEWGNVLPKDFIPQIPDPVAGIKLEGVMKEHELPLIESN